MISRTSVTYKKNIKSTDLIEAIKETNNGLKKFFENFPEHVKQSEQPIEYAQRMNSILDNYSLYIFSLSQETRRYKIKEQEWIDLVGRERFLKLSIKKRDFLINTAGALDLGISIDIKQVYNYDLF